MYFIGIDLGTSAVKLLMMDETGKYPSDDIGDISHKLSEDRAGLNKIPGTGGKQLCADCQD